MVAFRFQLVVGLSFTVSAFAAGLGAFVFLFGWLNMDTETLFEQLLPGSLVMGLVAAIVWPGHAIGARASMCRALLALVLAAPFLLTPSILRFCLYEDTAEFIGCALGTSYYMAKIFSVLAVSTVVMMGFLLSSEVSPEMILKNNPKETL